MKRIIDYDLKSQIIDCGLAHLSNKFNKFLFLFDKAQHEEDFNYKGLTNMALLDFLDASLLSIRQEAIERFNVDLLNEKDPLVIEAYKINRASYQRTKRLRFRVAKLLKKPCLFLTLTFNNEAMQATSIETKRRYVSRCLKQFDVPYIANVDYGSKNDRLHYHAIIQLERISHDAWIYGNLDFKKVVVPNDAAISKYLNKLTNHAIKETCKGNRLIYSRNV